MTQQRYDCNWTEGDFVIVDNASEVNGEVCFRVWITDNGSSSEMLLKPEDVPRLIAQLTAALPSEPLGDSEQLPAEKVQLGSDAIECLKVLKQGSIPNTAMVASLENLYLGGAHTVLMDLEDKGLARSELLNGGADNGWHVTPEGIAELERQIEAVKIEPLAEEEIDSIVKAVVATTADDTMEVRIAVVAGFRGGEIAIGTFSSQADIPMHEAMLLAKPNGVRHETKFVVTARVPRPRLPAVHEVKGEVEVSNV